MSVVRQGIFANNAFTASFTGLANTTYTGALVTYDQRRRGAFETGSWSLFIHGTGVAVLTPQIQFCVDQGNETYNPNIIGLSGYTNGTAALVTTFTAANGFMCNLSAWIDQWLYSDGFRILIVKNSANAITFTDGSIHAI